MQIGFIGLGDIGMPMARRLHSDGHRVKGMDLSSQRSDALLAHGVPTVDSVGDLKDSEVLCLAVSDDWAVREVLETSGLLKSLSSGSTVLIHSTVLPETVSDLETFAVDLGLRVHDAPVSGGAARALEGTLTLMVGGNPTEAASSVLDSLGETVLAGPVGAGAALKLANQLSMLAALQAMHEGLDLTQHYGVDLEVVLSTLQSSTGDSWVARNWGFFPELVATYDSAGTPVKYRPWSKDLWDVVAAARRAEVRVPLAGLLAQVLPEEVERRAKPSGGVA